MFDQISKSAQREILKESNVCINIGSGQLKLPGNWINLDYDKQYKPDVVHDLTVLPWPFQDNKANVVWSSHVIEHLPDHKTFLMEMHRITKKDGLFVLMFPHYSRSWFSNQHARAYGIHVLDGYENMFKVERVKLKYTWWGWKHWYKLPAYIGLWFVELLANASPWFWERVWCYWFGGFDQVIIEARVLKDSEKQTIDAMVHRLEG